ncbi:MAG: 4Fe-4S dicluster domain-containing protein [Rhodospirillales bacterium]|jgi:molybdopterin-containing oxidoreductase family iron-sulfur binding subunit|nr:4Fe-4S ferredoxin [Rhodospirillaceae bacterium]MDP6428163.1 4Fe-4S dicluster domain-containing protein [Rhodospirillales bacterium]MDP6642954.1 4Fe-4S dicluster domain-containing protein [Rhodospirillales bacterium]MDP6842913.1 4Fe-4S dicluster domain-containing protein [Rhodospirillales bacterium]|tara:strand:- start:188 stop:928 length:741 start_codon:yes stop_codon:yes gene_type:complete
MSIDKGRRAILGGFAAAAGTAIAPGIFLLAPAAARAPDAPASDKVRWGLLIDTNKCETGCDACVAACFKENGIGNSGRPASDPQWIRKVKVENPKTGFTREFPVMCQHCAAPPCVDVCPTGASFKRQDGIVLVDKHTCIGCRYCIMACPYKARSFVHEDLTDQKPDVPRGKGSVEGCTLCVHRVDRGQIPACAEACAAKDSKAAGAITFGDLNDAKSDIAKKIAAVATKQIRADLGLDPGVRYLGL